METTYTEKILLAAAKLHQPFSAEALVVEAWRQSPKTFGLKGYAEQYPDSNKVLSYLMGGRGVVKRGYLHRLSPCMYTITAEGKRWIAPDPEPVKPKPAVSKPADTVSLESAEYDVAAQHLFASTARYKFGQGKRGDIDFGDAGRFWRLSADDDPTRQVEYTGLAIDALSAACKKGMIVLRSGRRVELGETIELAEIDAYLKQRFARHLQTLSNRSKKCAG